MKDTKKMGKNVVKAMAFGMAAMMAVNPVVAAAETTEDTSAKGTATGETVAEPTVQDLMKKADEDLTAAKVAAGEDEDAKKAVEGMQDILDESVVDGDRENDTDLQDVVDKTTETVGEKATAESQITAAEIAAGLANIAAAEAEEAANSEDAQQKADTAAAEAGKAQTAVDNANTAIGNANAKAAEAQAIYDAVAAEAAAAMKAAEELAATEAKNTQDTVDEFDAKEKDLHEKLEKDLESANTTLSGLQEQLATAKTTLGESVVEKDAEGNDVTVYTSGAGKDYQDAQKNLKTANDNLDKLNAAKEAIDNARAGYADEANDGVELLTPEQMADLQAKLDALTEAGIGIGYNVYGTDAEGKNKLNNLEDAYAAILAQIPGAESARDDAKKSLIDYVQKTDENGPVFDEDGNPVYVQKTDENGPVFDENGDPVYVLTEECATYQLEKATKDVEDAKAAVQSAQDDVDAKKQQVTDVESYKGLYDAKNALDKAIEDGESEETIQALLDAYLPLYAAAMNLPTAGSDEHTTWISAELDKDDDDKIVGYTVYENVYTKTADEVPAKAAVYKFLAGEDDLENDANKASAVYNQDQDKALVLGESVEKQVTKGEKMFEDSTGSTVYYSASASETKDVSDSYVWATNLFDAKLAAGVFFADNYFAGKNDNDFVYFMYNNGYGWSEKITSAYELNGVHDLPGYDGHSIIYIIYGHTTTETVSDLVLAETTVNTTKDDSRTGEGEKFSKKNDAKADAESKANAAKATLESEGWTDLDVKYTEKKSGIGNNKKYKYIYTITGKAPATDTVTTVYKNGKIYSKTETEPAKDAVPAQYDYIRGEEGVEEDTKKYDDYSEYDELLKAVETKNGELAEAEKNLHTYSEKKDDQGNVILGEDQKPVMELSGGKEFYYEQKKTDYEQKKAAVEDLETQLALAKQNLLDECDQKVISLLEDKLAKAEEALHTYSEKKDDQGNVIYGEDGKPVMELTGGAEYDLQQAKKAYEDALGEVEDLTSQVADAQTAADTAKKLVDDRLNELAAYNKAVQEAEEAQQAADELQQEADEAKEKVQATQADVNAARAYVEQTAKNATNLKNKVDSGVKSLQAALDKAKEDLEKALEELKSLQTNLATAQAKATAAQTAAETAQAKATALKAAEEEAAKKLAEEEAAKKAAEEEAAKKAAEEEAAKKAAEEEAAKKAAEEEAAKKAAEEATKKAQDEAAAKQAAEEAAKKAADEAAQKAADEAAAKAAQEQATRLAEEEAARQASIDAARQANDAAKKAADEAAAKAAEEAARKAAENVANQNAQNQAAQDQAAQNQTPATDNSSEAVSQVPATVITDETPALADAPATTTAPAATRNTNTANNNAATQNTQNTQNTENTENTETADQNAADNNAVDNAEENTNNNETVAETPAEEPTTIEEEGPALSDSVKTSDIPEDEIPMTDGKVASSHIALIAGITSAAAAALFFFIVLFRRKKDKKDESQN
jgi:hypothetical protein